VATVVDQAKDAATKVTSVVKGLELGDKLQVYVVGPASGAAAAIGKASKVTVDVLAIYVVTPATDGGEYVLQLVKGIAPAEIVNEITATLLSAITAVKCAIAPVQRDIVAMYQHVQTRVFVSGMDYLMQNQRARIAAQVLNSSLRESNRACPSMQRISPSL
jgi:chemotaxis response regulator CheB